MPAIVVLPEPPLPTVAIFIDDLPAPLAHQLLHGARPVAESRGAVHYSPRQPSTSSAMATTVSAMASPGKTDSHHAR